MIQMVALLHKAKHNVKMKPTSITLRGPFDRLLQLEINVKRNIWMLLFLEERSAQNQNFVPIERAP